MHVDENYFGRDLLQKFVGHAERIVIGCHEDASLQINHRVRYFALHAFVHAGTWHVSRIVRWPQHTPSRAVTVAFDHLEVIYDLSLVPDVVSGGNNVDVQLEEFLGESRGDSESSRRVLAISDDQVDTAIADDLRKFVFNNVAAWPPEDVADKKYVHEYLKFDGITRKEWRRERQMRRVVWIQLRVGTLEEHGLKNRTCSFASSHQKRSSGFSF